MKTKTFMGLLILLCTVTVMLCSCNNSSQPPAQVETEQAPPDYSFVDKGLKDQSESVKTEAVKALVNLNHKQSIPRLIQAIIDSVDNNTITDLASGSLVTYKEDAIEPVKLSLVLNNKNIKLQSIGINILSQIEKPEEFVKEVKTEFDKLKPTEENRSYRIKYITLYLNQVDRKEHIADIVTLLLDEDGDFTSAVSSIIADWKDPEIARQMSLLLDKKNISDSVKTAILKILYNYDIYSGASPLQDFTPFLLEFGNVNPEIHNYAYLGIKKFGYKDKEDQIITYIKKFENCSDEVVRSNVIELQQFLPTVAVPEDTSVLTKFTIPENLRRKNSCI